MRKVFVVVLGDIGRSPRMCNHAFSLAKSAEDDENDGETQVNLIGYGGSALPTKIRSCRNISVSFMPTFPASLSALFPRLVTYFLKVLWQSLVLLWTLCSLAVRQGTPDVLLLQNPPSIPSMPVCHLFCRLMTCGRTRLVIDWHNYGYSILALAHGGSGSSHPIVRFSRKIESFYGRRSSANFCVTDAMRRDLESSNWGMERGTTTTLYDRAPDHFRPIDSPEEKRDVFERIGQKHPQLSSERFTKEEGGSIVMREKRPGLVVSSTSWTEDEDFSILVKALEIYEEGWSARYPDLVCVVTGKGPLKEHYGQILSERRWTHVSVVLPWLEPDDYPRLLACADLGVSLHASSSGLDLPMKVVDMFGCGLPVAALGFEALPELVKDGVNGMVFGNAEELAGQMRGWFEGFPEEGSEERRKMRENLREFQELRWEGYWNEVALPILRDVDR